LKEAPARIRRGIGSGNGAAAGRLQADWRKLGWLAGAAAAHRWFVLALAGGAALRVVTLLAYRPALFSPDSIPYLEAAERVGLPTIHPVGYSLFLRVAFGLHDAYTTVALLQHLLGLATAAILYATLLHLGVRRWLAALACAPLLLDAYQLNIEQYVLSDTLFQFLLVAACAALLWRPPTGIGHAALAGLALAAATITRAIGVLAVFPFALTALFLRERLTRAAALLGCFVVPVLAYATAFYVANGSFSLTGYEGRFLYGRVVQWVDCSEFATPAYERPLCPDAGGRELPWVYQYMWSRRSPLERVDPPPGLTRNDVAGDFARRAIRHQPLTYARRVGADALLSFSPRKFERRGEFRVSQWQFQLAYPIPGNQRGWTVSPPPAFSRGSADGRVDRPLASFLKSYQRFGYTPGPLLAVFLLVGVAASLGLARARRSGLRGATFLFVGLAVAICFGSVVSTMFSWRYQLPQLVLLPPAFALGVTALVGRGSRSPAGTSDTLARPTRTAAESPETEC
jgi:hypothetical protein